ncbi:MAG: hypothetical protein Q9193_003001, partial [Seirophora villosa]
TLKRVVWPRFLGGVKGNVVGIWPEQKAEDFRHIGQWMQEGKVKAVVDTRFPFEQAPQAVAKLKLGRTRGKIVVDVALET